MLLNPSSIREPIEHCGSMIPTPTKLRNASVKMAVGIENIICVMMGPIVLGRISMKMIRPLRAPSVRLAMMYSCSLFFSISARAILLMPIHSVSSSATMTSPIPFGMKVARTPTMTSLGIEFATSTNLCIRLSATPPKYPEIRPKLIPTIISMNIVTNAISRDTRAPYQTLVHRSLPRESVPNRNVQSANSSS